MINITLNEDTLGTVVKLGAIGICGYAIYKIATISNEMNRKFRKYRDGVVEEANDVDMENITFGNPKLNESDRVFMYGELASVRADIYTAKTYSTLDDAMRKFTDMADKLEHWNTVELGTYVCYLRERDRQRREAEREARAREEARKDREAAIQAAAAGKSDVNVTVNNKEGEE